jgi:hypothetical protein
VSINLIYVIIGATMVIASKLESIQKEGSTIVAFVEAAVGFSMFFLALLNH